MSNLILCKGEYSKTPYLLKGDCKNVYCIEELCYYLYHNAYLLSDEFVEFALADWISDNLGLTDLGREINKICKKTNALAKLIELLSEHIGFYSDKEWKELLDCIVKNNDLSVNERRKIRADGFLSAGKYGLATDEYEIVISKAMAGEDRLRAKAYHNLGVCAAKLFMYEKAAQYFAKAYETFANTESYISMLSAMKLYMPSSEYLEYLSSHKESYEDSLEVERRFDSIKDGFDTQPIGRYLSELAGKKSTASDYYDGIESLTEEVKEEYRNQIYRGRTGGC